MGRCLRAIALTVTLLGCGGSLQSPGKGFINHTSHGDAELWAIWSAAQRSVANQVDLNPVQQSSVQAPPEILPGDVRAMSIQPQELLVSPEADASSSALFAATGIRRSDPTGMIACPQPCDVRFTTAYSQYQPPLTRFAASWDVAGGSFEVILQYEFENQILFALGYDLRWR